MPIAMPRSRPAGNSCATSARETANITAPPMPCRARARLRKVGSGDSAQSSEASEKIPSPIAKTPPAAEAVGERAGGQHEGGERQRVGVDHPLQVGEAAAEVLRIDGSATLTTVMSSSSMNVATETATRVHHLRSI